MAVILLTAFHDSTILEQATDAHVFSYLVKPIDKTQLESAITIAWNRYDEFSRLRQETTDLRQALEDRKVIEQAKWVIVQRKSMDEPDAMRLLQRQARNNRRTLVEVARSVLENDKLFS